MESNDMVMSESADVGYSEDMEKRPMRKQFDLDMLASMRDTELKSMLYGLMTNSNSMFRQEIQTTLESYGLIINEREGSINQIMK